MARAVCSSVVSGFGISFGKPPRSLIVTRVAERRREQPDAFRLYLGHNRFPLEVDIVLLSDFLSLVEHPCAFVGRVKALLPSSSRKNPQPSPRGI